MMAVIDVVPPQADLQKHDMVLEYTHDRPSDPVHGFNFFISNFSHFNDKRSNQIALAIFETCFQHDSIMSS